MKTNSVIFFHKKYCSYADQTQPNFQKCLPNKLSAPVNDTTLCLKGLVSWQIPKDSPF